MKSTPFKQMSFEEKRKAFSWYVDAIKDMKYGTYKNISERFGVSERHLRRLRSGDRNIQFKLFDRIRKSFRKLAKDNYYFVASIEGQSDLVVGTTVKVLTERAAKGTLRRIESSQKSDHIFFAKYWRHGTKDAFGIEDMKGIVDIINYIEEELDLIFINTYDFMTDLINEVETSQKREAELLYYDVM